MHVPIGPIHKWRITMTTRKKFQRRRTHTKREEKKCRRRSRDMGQMARWVANAILSLTSQLFAVLWTTSFNTTTIYGFGVCWHEALRLNMHGRQLLYFYLLCWAWLNYFKNRKRYICPKNERSEGRWSKKVWIIERFALFIAPTVYIHSVSFILFRIFDAQSASVERKRRKEKIGIHPFSDIFSLFFFLFHANFALNVCRYWPGMVVGRAEDGHTMQSSVNMCVSSFPGLACVWQTKSSFNYNTVCATEMAIES